MTSLSPVSQNCHCRMSPTEQQNPSSTMMKKQQKQNEQQRQRQHHVQLSFCSPSFKHNRRSQNHNNETMTAFELQHSFLHSCWSSSLSSSASASACISSTKRKRVFRSLLFSMQLFTIVVLSMLPAVLGTGRCFLSTTSTTTISVPKLQFSITSDDDTVVPSKQEKQLLLMGRLSFFQCNHRHPFHSTPFLVSLLRGGSATTHSSSSFDKNNNSHQSNEISSGDNSNQQAAAATTTTPTEQTTSAQQPAEQLSLSQSSPPQTPLPSWKAALPERLQRKSSKTFQRFQLGPVEIFVLGTAHISSESRDDVRELLETVHPQAILVELCEARMALLEGGGQQEQQTATEAAASGNETSTVSQRLPSVSKQPLLSFWDKVSEVQQSQGSTSRMHAISTVLLTRVQEDYAKELGVELGSEFQAAYQYWKKRRSAAASRQISNPSNQQQQQVEVQQLQHLPKCLLLLGDRPLHLTLVRAWESLWWWPKMKVFCGLLWSSLSQPSSEEIKAWLAEILQEESDVLTKSFEELKQHFPSLYETIIEERDAWLSAKITQTAQALGMHYFQQQQRLWRETITSDEQQQQVLQRPRLVAIVGAGHVPGITQWLTSNHTTATADTSRTYATHGAPKERQATSSSSSPSTVSLFVRCGCPETPEDVLKHLVQTRKWAQDPAIQNQMIPTWIHDIPQVQDDIGGNSF